MKEMTMGNEDKDGTFPKTASTIFISINLVLATLIVIYLLIMVPQGIELFRDLGIPLPVLTKLVLNGYIVISCVVLSVAFSKVPLYFILRKNSKMALLDSILTFFLLLFVLIMVYLSINMPIWALVEKLEGK